MNVIMTVVWSFDLQTACFHILLTENLVLDNKDFASKILLYLKRNLLLDSVLFCQVWLVEWGKQITVIEKNTSSYSLCERVRINLLVYRVIWWHPGWQWSNDVADYNQFCPTELQQLSNRINEFLWNLNNIICN